MKMPGPKSPDQMALATSAAAAGQTAGPLPPQDGDIQCEPIWPLMPGQAGEELPFQAINRSNSLPSDYLPTPARSPTEMWDRRHGMTHSRIISESIIVPRAKSTTSTFFAQNNEIGPKIGGQWHVAQCVSPHDASGDERENFLSWLLAKTSQPEAWESFDQHIATRAAYFGCVRESPVGVSESYLRSTVCDHIKAATIMAGSGALESWPYGYTASSEHIVHALPSEPSFRYILSTGLDALSGDDLFERHPPAVRNSPYDPLFRHLVPLVLAQGLLVSESQEARRLALGLLDAEVLILEGELGITIECSQHSTRRSLFLRVAAFSGHGQYMQMAERQHMSRLIVSLLIRVPILSLKVFQHTRSLISNDTYSMDCDGSYRLDLELSMVFGRAPAIAAMAIVPENDDVGSAITQVSTRDERHPRRDTMLAAQDWLKTNAQCLPSQSPIPELEPLEDDLEAILGVINKQAYHARQLWTITNVGSGLVKPESFPHAEIAIRHWLSRWHQAFIAGSQTVKMTARRCKLLWLYSLVWLTWLADVPAIERKSRRVAADQAQAVSGNGQIDRDVDLMQIHCGQIFRLAQITNCTQPLWWPLAIYRATLIVWDASMSPQQKGSQSTIDPNLILSTDLGPFEVWPLSTTAIDELPLEDDHLQSILNGHRDLNGTLSLRDGSKISLDHPKGILEYGIDVLEHGSSSLLRDGVIMRLKGMQMAWYGE